MNDGLARRMGLNDINWTLTEPGTDRDKRGELSGIVHRDGDVELLAYSREYLVYVGRFFWGFRGDVTLPRKSHIP